MGRKRIALLASSTLLLVTGWVPLGVTTTVAIGGSAIVAGCEGKADTRQDVRTEERTEDRMEERRD